jgi:hypothetical protein
LTLGAVLMLGGVTGGWGDELSGSVGAGGPSSGGFSWPALPDEWNWSDLPVRLSASESVSYTPLTPRSENWREGRRGNYQ